MRPLVCTDKPPELESLRRSRRRRGSGERTARLELRLELEERDAWIAAAGREAYLSLSDWARDRLNAAARLGVHFSSRVESWNTPPVVIAALSRALGSITLDPCSNTGSIVPASIAWILERDGDSLARSWRCSGSSSRRRPLVYVNPPYNQIAAWVAKCAREALEHRLELVALVPARTETRWWNAAIDSGAVAGYWRGRLQFLSSGAKRKNSAPFPSALLYWGQRPARFRSIREIRT